MYIRGLAKIIIEALQPGQTVVLAGSRRTGKTFVMNQIMQQLPKNSVLEFLGDDLDSAEQLSQPRLSVLKRLVEGFRYIFIDEAQMIPNIGQTVKLMIDKIPGISIFLTGSSSLDLKGNAGDPLTGRGVQYFMYPLAQSELAENYMTIHQSLDLKLIYGLYPQVYSETDLKKKRQILENIRNGYLLKDILMLDNVKDSLFINQLLKLIAFQIGNDVSYSELANTLGVSKNTVMRYLDLLEKCFVIFSLRGFNRNLRKEVVKSPRYYFWDNGIRNVIISNFNGLQNRDDIGRLWENYCISERMKHNHYRGYGAQYYFWRTYDQKEIDFVEEINGHLSGFEFKWGDKKYKIPQEFLSTYENSEITIVNRDNYLNYIM